MKTSRKKPTAKKSASKKHKPKKQTPSNGTNKSQSIRDAFRELGKKTRPKDIIAALAEQGIKVASAQVSTVLKAAGLRRGRRRRKVVVAAAAKASANGQSSMIDELLKVKKLAKDLGGTSKLKELVVALEGLL
jgi:arginine repressor